MSERRSHLVLVGLILAMLAGVALLSIPGSPVRQKPTLGLDLQGGLEVVLQAVPEKGRKLTKSDLDRSVSIMRNRVDKLGVSEPEIRKQGSDQIVIELPGIRDQEAAAALIGKTAQLELYDLQNALVGPSKGANQQPVAHTSLFRLLNAVQRQAKRGEPETYFLFNEARKKVAGPLRSPEDLLKKRGGELPNGWKILAVPQNTVVVTCGRDAPVCPEGFQGVVPDRTYYYLFTHRPNHPTDPIPEMTAEHLRLSGTRQDFDTSGRTAGPIVTMQFTDEGSERFHDITAEIAQRGRLQTNTIGGGQKITQNFAIVLDREIKSWPQIDWEEYPNGIAGGGGAQITGLDSVEEAKNLALVLQTGALPVRFNTLEHTNISATLGADSLKEAQRAAIAGLLVVALFLLVFYRFLGLVAVIGLGIYAAFLYAAILLFNVTLTLPGFAGMILTIGVAADANIVVFERIKEEARAGKSVRAAIAAGYGKGFHTIIDANVVTAITALVLFAVATASVKGFALMLLIGTAMSLVTAVAATRAMLGLLAGFSWFDNPRFMGAAGQQTAKWLQIDFVGRRRFWFAISATVLALAVGALAVKGLNLGIDFRGGTQVTFTTPQPVAVEDVRAQAAKIGHENAQVQGREAETGGKYESFRIRTTELERTELSKLQNDLREAVGARAFGTETVSESFGRQIANAAILAIVFSLFLIVVYITIRFQFKFAVPVILALLHDVMITIGIYALIGAEVSTATVAAILTVLGYSIYDTIIIFDRIRENMPLMRRAPFATIANVSLWETVRRSLATTFITLLPIGALYLFGGETLRDFALALLVGIGSGAYSSIFIAAPLLSMWKEREPDYARRIGSPDVAGDGVGALTAATEAAAAEPAPTPELVPVTGGERAASEAKRERRRQRRRARPHGRAR